MMDAPPRGPVDVSIIVIAYNEAERIGDCLDALADQDYDGMYEVIVVDDGSADATSEIAREARGNVVVHTLAENTGRGNARSVGVAIAAGRLVGFVDADVRVPPTWLSQCVEVVESGTAAVSGIAVPDGDVAVIYRIFGAIPRPVRGSGAITGNNVMFDGSVLRTTGFDPDARLGEDFRLARQLLRSGHRIMCIEDLHVSHDERKTYLRAVRWLYESGKDATVLLAEFGEIRTPDIAWGGWVLGTVSGVIVAVVGGPWWSGAASLALAVGASAVHVGTRFRPGTRPGRYLLTHLANLPLMGAYLIGRCVGIPAALSLLTRRK